MTSLATAFDPRANGIGFLRWLLAVLVIVAIAGPVGGFSGGHELGVGWGAEQSVRGAAVGALFFLSGFLLARSRERVSTVRFVGRRLLRIVPAWWVVLLATALVFAPIAWVRATGGLSGYFLSTRESPLSYFVDDMLLVIGQRDIAGIGATLPYAATAGARDWNAPASTLVWGAVAVAVLALLGLVAAVLGEVARRRVTAAVLVVVLALATLQFLHGSAFAFAGPLLTHPSLLLLLAPFAFGALLAVLADRIPVDDRLAIAALVIAVVAFHRGGWLVFGQYALFYVLLWFAVRVRLRPLQRWTRFGEPTLGLYLFAWPVSTLLAALQLPSRGPIVFVVVALLLCHVLAFASWHLIEKPAIELGDATPRRPRWMRRAAPRGRS